MYMYVPKPTLHQNIFKQDLQSSLIISLFTFDEWNMVMEGNQYIGDKFLWLATNKSDPFCIFDQSIVCIYYIYLSTSVYILAYCPVLPLSKIIYIWEMSEGTTNDHKYISL